MKELREEIEKILKDNLCYKDFPTDQLLTLFKKYGESLVSPEALSYDRAMKQNKKEIDESAKSALKEVLDNKKEAK